jgi:short-subunit dehydrogenase
VRAIDRNKDEVYVPIFWGVLMAIIKLIPNNIFRRIKL